MQREPADEPANLEGLRSKCEKLEERIRAQADKLAKIHASPPLSHRAELENPQWVATTAPPISVSLGLFPHHHSAPLTPNPVEIRWPMLFASGMQTPPTLAELFPTLAHGVRTRISREVVGFPSDPFELPFQPLLFFQELLLSAEARQFEEQERGGLAALERISLTILGEVRTARTYDADGHVSSWLRLSVATLVARAAFETGDIARTHEWLLRALVANYRNYAENVIEIDTVVGALAAPQPIVGAIVTDAVLNWFSTLFAHSVRSGDLKELADEVFDIPDKMLFAGLIQLASFPGLVSSMLVARAEWATRYKPDEARKATLHLFAVLNSKALSPKQEAEIDVFITNDPNLAEFQLARYKDILEPEQRLVLRFKVANGNATRLRAAHHLVLNDLEDIRKTREKASKTPTERLLRSGQAFRLLYPLIIAYAEAGDVAGVVEVMTAWLIAPNAEGVQSPLLGVTAHTVGTMWVSTAVAPKDRSSRDALGAFIAALNLLLDLSILNSDNPIPYQPQRSMLYPHPEHSSVFVEAALALLRLDALAELPHPLPSTIVMVPGQTVPIQPLLIREIDHPAMLSVSLKQPRPSRQVRRAALFGDNTLSSPMELDAVEAVFRASGVHVDRLPATKRAFTMSFEDPSYDVIWVAAHGDHRPYHLEESALILGEEEVVSLDVLASLDVPANGRRALVLNICSGGMSASVGGPLGLGLGPVLAGPTQSVFTHLWPISFQFAAAFGGLLARSLAKTEDHLAAYADALGVILRGRESTVAALASIGLRTIADRLHENIDLENVLSWGAPVLLT